MKSVDNNWLVQQSPILDLIEFKTNDEIIEDAVLSDNHHFDDVTVRFVEHENLPAVMRALLDPRTASAQHKLIDTFYKETALQVEVELHGGEYPVELLIAQHVDIDLGHLFGDPVKNLTDVIRSL